MFISSSYCRLLILCVAHLSLDNCFSGTWEEMRQILHDFRRFKMSFFVTEFPQLFKIAWILLMISSLLFRPHLLEDI